MLEIRNNWFKSWFDTKYYHILYKHRNNEEASYFIRNLVNKLNIPLNSNVADIACGKGRHSLELSKYDLNVWGMDLSSNSIQFANENANDRTEFSVHDMRDPFPKGNFDYIFNLFTSFGYFEDSKEDLNCIENISNALKSGGYFIQDYINAKIVISNFPQNEAKIIDDVEFGISKLVNGIFIEKHIHVKHHNFEDEFMERVKIISKDELVRMYAKVGLKLISVFGNYSLEDFVENSSPRIILISQKVC
jgi:SAM-dependent methyltransferase